MNGFVAFTKKEFTEQLRSYRALILLAVLFVFGMLSPLLAKMMPDLFAHMSLQGMTIKIPKPTVLDAWGQFFKNISQMGLVVLLLIFSGALPQELSKGTLILPLSKGLSRSAVVAAKFFSASVTWTVAFAAASLTGCAYTYYLFGRFTEPRLFFSLLCLWVFGIFLLSLLLLAGAIAPGSYGGLLLAAAMLGVLIFLSMFPKLQKWNPATLAGSNSTALSSLEAAHIMQTALVVTLILTALFLAGSMMAFYRKKL